MAEDFDLIVLGGGSGGLAGAFRAAEHGARVALLEPSALGGTCVNVGCVPKKAMWIAAELAGRLRLAGALGFPVEPACPDWAELVAAREGYIENIHASYRRRLDEAGVALLPVRGRFTGPRTIECDDGVRLDAAHVLVATGGHPFVPDLPGASLGGTSDDFFDWTHAPGRVALVGGGYVAVELAGVLQALGVRVDMFVRGQRLMDSFDAEVTALLAEDYRQAGIRVHFGHDVRMVEGAGEAFRIRARADRVDVDFDGFDRVLFATGRRPNTDGLGLDVAGVATDARGHVVIDAHNDTNVDGVHAVGDVGTDPPLTPVAIAAARRLMDRLFGGIDRPLDRGGIPTVVFSHPPIGKVGLGEVEARERFGDDAVHVARSNFRPMLHALADSPQRSLFKLVCAGPDRRVVGLHLLGEGADEILQGFAVAMKRGATLDDLHDTVAIHPTSAEEVVLMR
jgi:glutathione reductase (NADPH)